MAQTIRLTYVDGLSLTLKLFDADGNAVGEVAGYALTEVSTGQYRTNAVADGVSGENLIATIETATQFEAAGFVTIEGVADSVAIVGVQPVDLSAIESTLGTPVGASLAADVAAVAGGTGPHAITVTCEDGDSNGVPNVLVSVVGSTRKATTNASGVAVLNVDSATYTLRYAVPFGYESLTDEVVVVGGDTSVDKTLTATTIAEPSDPALCRVFVYLNLNGVAVSGATFSALVADANSATDGVVLSTVIASDTTDANGYAELDLVRGGQFTDGDGEYRLQIVHDGKSVWDITTTIPDQASVNLEDLLPL